MRNATKYRKRKSRELANRKERENRFRHEAYLRHLRQQEANERIRQAKLLNPRRLYIQKLVNMLNAKLQNDPIYKMWQLQSVFSLWGDLPVYPSVNIEDLISKRRVTWNKH